MKVLIDMPDTIWDWIVWGFLDEEDKDKLIDLIKNGEQIPDNATNGDVIKTFIKALFPDMELADNFGFWVNLIDEGGHGVGDFYALWLNAPYKGEPHENKFPKDTRMGAGLRDSKAEKGDKKNDNPL